MEQEAKKSFLINLLYYLTVAALIYILCRFLLKYLMPFVIGALIAWAVQRPAAFLSRKTKIKRSVCAGVTAAAVFIGAAALIAFLGYRLISAAGGLLNDLSARASELSGYINSLRDALDSFIEKLPKEFTSAADSFFDKSVNKLFTSITEFVSSAAGQTAKRAPGFALSVVVSVVASCYIAADFPGLARFLRSLCGKRIYVSALKVKDIFVNSIFKFIKGYAILMLMTFAELLAGLLILRFKYAPLLAALIALIDILPVLGTGTVLVPWAVFELFIANSGLGAGLLILYACITLIRNFAEPKIIGRQMGVNPLFTLIFMFIGAKLSGIAGMIILPIVFIVVVKYYKAEMENEKGSF